MWKERLANIELSRIYTAIIMLIVIIILAIFHSFWLVWGFLGIIYLIALFEVSHLYFKNESLSYYFLAVGILIWAGAILTIYSLLYSLWVIFALIMLAASFQAYTKKGDALIIMPLIYPTISFLTFLALYTNWGIASLVFLLIVVATSDTLAFFGGKLFGKKPFCPTSPKKTVEGVIIGIVCATLFGASFAYVWWVEVSFIQALLLSCITSLAAIFGDLYESYLKRNANVKDSGSLLPGHGGVLDRIDGYLFAAIALYPLLLWLLNP